METRPPPLTVFLRHSVCLCVSILRHRLFIFYSIILFFLYIYFSPAPPTHTQISLAMPRRPPVMESRPRSDLIISTLCHPIPPPPTSIHPALHPSVVSALVVYNVAISCRKALLHADTAHQSKFNPILTSDTGVCVCVCAQLLGLKCVFL